jgi:hypothetical protein
MTPEFTAAIDGWNLQASRKFDKNSDKQVPFNLKLYDDSTTFVPKRFPRHTELRNLRRGSIQ